MAFLRKFIDDESGATAIEYGVIIALLGSAVVVGAGALGGSLAEKWTGIKNEVVAN